MTAETCPICGSPVEVDVDEDGTPSYKPIIKTEVRHYRPPLRRDEWTHQEEDIWVTTEIERLRRQR